MILRSRFASRSTRVCKEIHRKRNITRNLGEVCIIEDKHTAIDTFARMAESGYLHDITTPFYLYVCVCVHISQYLQSLALRQNYP